MPKLTPSDLRGLKDMEEAQEDMRRDGYVPADSGAQNGKQVAPERGASKAGAGRGGRNAGELGVPYGLRFGAPKK